MALGDPFQILLILGVLAVILIWGPQKIPELARSIGKARKEFDDASKGLVQPASSSSTTVSTPDSPSWTIRRKPPEFYRWECSTMLFSTCYKTSAHVSLKFRRIAGDRC